MAALETFGHIRQREGRACGWVGLNVIFNFLPAHSLCWIKRHLISQKMGQGSNQAVLSSEKAVEVLTRIIL